MKPFPWVIIVVLGLCRAVSAATPAELKAELIAADTAFSAASAREGTYKAFMEVATAGTKLLSQTVQGLGGVKREFSAAPPTATLTWAPSFADVAASGDLGYTWGRWAYTDRGADGKPVTTRGTYVTVWRRQPDGAWKVVLDGGDADPQEKKP